MDELKLKQDFVDGKKDLSQCAVCDVYVHQQESFTCPRCRKGPLCRRHRVSGRKECASCVFDLRKKELQNLRNQETNIRQFLRFLQFLFLVFAVLFVAAKFGLTEFVEVLQDSDFTKYLLYLGMLPVLGYLLFLLLLLGQRGKVAEAELQLKKLDSRR